MASKLAAPLAFSLGGVEVSKIRTEPKANRVWLIEWEAISTAWTPAFVVGINGKHYETVIDKTHLQVRVNNDETPVVEIIQIEGVHGDPSYFPSTYFSTTQANKIKLTWNPPGDVSDVSAYRIYWDNGTGTVQFTDAFLIGDSLIEDGSSSYTFWTQEITPDTYKFVIRTIDDAGNESTGTTATTVILTVGYPGVVTGVTKAFAGGNVTLTWADPSDISGGDVKVYHNAGDADNQFVDYGTVIATIPAGTQSWTAAIGDGIWAFGLRVDNGTAEELNTLIMASMRIESAAQVGNAPSRPTLSAQATAGGTVLLRGSVNPGSSLGVPNKIKFFTNDGAGGAVDYGTALGSGFITLSRLMATAMATLTTTGYNETERIFGCRAYTSAGVASQNAAEFTITPEATAPPDPLSIVGVEGRN